MTQPVHDDTGDCFHADGLLAPCLPVDGACKAGDRVVQPLLTTPDRPPAPRASRCSRSGTAQSSPSAAAFCSRASAFFSVAAGPLAAGALRLATVVRLAARENDHRHAQPQAISGASVGALLVYGSRLPAVSPPRRSLTSTIDAMTEEPRQDDSRRGPGRARNVKTNNGIPWRELTRKQITDTAATK